MTNHPNRSRRPLVDALEAAVELIATMQRQGCQPGPVAIPSRIADVLATEKLPNARVWFDPIKPSGWFYKIGDETAVGPYETTIMAGRACREVLINRAKDRS